MRFFHVVGFPSKFVISNYVVFYCVVVARLISQSCQPNLKGVIGIGKDGVPVVQLVTTREVKPGEALTLDYLSQNCHRKLGLVSERWLLFTDDKRLPELKKYLWLLSGVRL